MGNVVDVKTDRPMLAMEGESVTARLSTIGSSLVQRTESARSDEDAEAVIQSFFQELEAGEPVPSPVLTGAAPSWQILDGALVVEAIRRWADSHGYDPENVSIRAHAVIAESPLQAYSLLFDTESGMHPVHSRSERVQALVDYLRWCSDMREQPEGYRPLARRFHLATDSVLHVLRTWKEASEDGSVEQWQATVIETEREALRTSHPARVNAPDLSFDESEDVEDVEDIDEIAKRMSEIEDLAAKAVSAGRFRELVVDQEGDHWEDAADELAKETSVLAKLPPDIARTVQEVGGRLDGLVRALKWCQGHDVNPRAVLQAVGGLEPANELPFILAMAPDPDPAHRI
jgi:hypothetical protein